MATTESSPPGSVSVAGLSKRYGRDAGVRALDDFTLDFPAGQCTVLLGPSGCGKTTVLRSIAGLVTPDAGRISLDGDVVFDGTTRTDVPPEKRRLGMVFQSYALWPHLNVAENIAYPLATSGLPKAQVEARTESMLQWIGLGGMGRRFAHELSGGQQQRVSLGRAMVGTPRAILFDEPLSNLDARLRERMRMELLALRQQAPFTSIYVTHDQLEAMTLGDRVVVMRAGRIEQTGSPEDVYKRPRTRFAADFVGIPNLLEGTVRSVNGPDVAVETIVGTLRTTGWRRDWSAGARCTVAVRPTLIGIEDADAAGGRPGRVIQSVFQGTSSVDLVDVDGTQIAVESFAEERRSPGTRVSVKPAPGALFALLDD
ncbi:MAG TPA: ABC transporter ATP-binding protein [Caldimonas sp.]|jgi:iron(III) transport system ATP-binding protein|nr:ABC transporter ATP-binding protein [Caldimonas sp.]